MKLLLTLFALLVPTALAQTMYGGVTTGTPIFNEDFRLGVQVGANLTPEFEVRVTGEGNLGGNALPNLITLDALYNFYLNVDRLTPGTGATVGSPTNNSLYIGFGGDSFYGKKQRRLNRAYRFGLHGIIGGEAMMGRFGVFAELQPGFVFSPDWDMMKPSVRGRLGINFHL